MMCDLLVTVKRQIQMIALYHSSFHHMTCGTTFFHFPIHNITYLQLVLHPD